MCHERTCRIVDVKTQYTNVEISCGSDKTATGHLRRGRSVQRIMKLLLLALLAISLRGTKYTF